MTQEEFAKSWVPRIIADPQSFGIAGCLICHDPNIQMIGFWEPAKHLQREMGAPAGKLRVLFYAVCKACFDRGDAHTLVEDIMLAKKDSLQPHTRAGRN